jgi:hypothetical protein
MTTRRYLYGDSDKRLDSLAMANDDDSLQTSLTFQQWECLPDLGSIELCSDYHITASSDQEFVSSIISNRERQRTEEVNETRTEQQEVTKATRTEPQSATQLPNHIEGVEC